ncbi:Endonuclease/exonuclease/phosphatase [Mycena epipterygia]|nr:Endonuclease/exonuclease/phosphatase [Mycena epipterygia]
MSSRRRRPPRGCPQDEDHAPAFFNRKRDKQQVGNPPIARNTRAAINLSAININGIKATLLAQESHKWHGIHRMMREHKLGVLVVMETHMSAAQALEIEESYMNKRLKLFNYEYPNNPAAKGVAIVLNREITNVEGVKVHYLIPGKAILAVIPWHSTKTLTILGIYAPTESDKEKISFWNALCDLWLTNDLPVPDAMGGDLNLVADAIDRLPHHMDPDQVVTAYLRFVCLMELKDGWRQNNPETKAYTHASTRGTLSCIDRILVSPTLMKNCHHWSIDDIAGGLTDHRMVSVTVSAPGAPYIRKGRWAMPDFLLYDKEFMGHATEEACKLEDSISEPRSELSNTQTRFASFKEAVLELANKRARTAVGVSAQKKKALVNEREMLLNGLPPDPLSEETAELVAQIEKKIDELVNHQRDRKRLETRVRGCTELNHITKYAVALSKDAKPRDTLTYLRRTDNMPERGSRRSSEMAEIARDYHNDLQSDGMDTPREARADAQKTALESIPRPEAEVDMKPLAEKLTEEDVSTALKEATPGKAAGINGMQPNSGGGSNQSMQKVQKMIQATHRRRKLVI